MKCSRVLAHLPLFVAGILLTSAGFAQTTVTTVSGTTNTLAKFSGSSTIVNSVITESNGNIGVGTDSPGQKLDVSGGVGASSSGYYSQGLQVIASDGVSNYLWTGAKLYIQSGSKILGAITNTGNVGIGMTNPTSPLTVVGPNLGTTLGNTANLLSLGNSNSNSNSSFLNVYQLRSSNGTDWTTSTTRIQQVIDSTGMGYIDFNPPNGNFAIAFGSGICCGSTSTANEYMRIVAGGNVGIGTTSPEEKLEVDGNVKLGGSGTHITFSDGSTQSTAWTGVLCGGDYAESVDVSGDRTRYEPGDVLVITSNSDGDVGKSTEPYSTMVAGIYATKPGLVGRRQITPKRAEEVPMAMLGIVPVKVTTENGPIRRGDFLVTSSKQGYAMKGTDRGRIFGAVIGKAMGTLETGSGVIEALVALQ